MAWYQTDVPHASHWHQQALALARETGDSEVEALSLSNLGAQATELGDYDRAVADYEASLTVARAAEEPEATEEAEEEAAEEETAGDGDSTEDEEDEDSDGDEEDN